ncbi:antibiotic biosynthesis monooxygenase [Tateyamaria omphalii]|uniref:putative quinol monooxygenase n=1 Tax=Tateyamaria omphalii TaxID=299262 RepID=UPI001C99D1D5|nr:antibiotic biosynthesis monooxygenase [Tateyamaria omphalii]MBY5932411.1 antibiotic biosynthesis monooxygenase [Tateyamaria omphalii]
MGVTLEGFLRCASEDEAARVRAALPEHVQLTRAEPGCIRFDVTPTDDPLVWAVSEEFVDPAAFEAHQARACASDWARETQGIARDYTVTGVP